MRKKNWILGLSAVGMMAVLAACGGNANAKATTSATEAAKEGTTPAAKEEKAEGNKESNGKKLKVTLLVTGSFGDKAFNDSAQAGMKKIQEELSDKAEVTMVEMGSDKTKFEGAMQDASESDADLIITGLWDMKEITEKIAQEYPEKKYILFDTAVDYTLGDLSNVYSMSYKQNEGAFLAGVLAAGVTKSSMPYANEDNIIGFVGAKDTAAVINDSAVGYIQGAKFMDPEVKVLVSYVGSYVDSATAKDLALTQYANNADTVFVAAGPASVGVIEAAAESKKYVIGVDSDQAEAYAGKPEQEYIISSAIKNVGESLYLSVEKAAEDKLPFGEAEVLGLKDGVVGIAENDIYKKEVPEDVQKKVEDAKQDILGGKVTVDTAYGMEESKLKSIISGE